MLWVKDGLTCCSLGEGTFWQGSREILLIRFIIRDQVTPLCTKKKRKSKNVRCGRTKQVITPCSRVWPNKGGWIFFVCRVFFLNKGELTDTDWSRLRLGLARLGFGSYWMQPGQCFGIFLKSPFLGPVFFLVSSALYKKKQIVPKKLGLHIGRECGGC